MILELDFGNSSVKWRMVDASGALLDRGVAVGIEALLAAVSGTGIHVAYARISLVASWQARSGQVVAALESRLGCRCAVAVSVARQQGLRNAYAQPERLGVDRWLAMLAGWQQYKGSFVVIDAGSALTVDHVNEEGLHLGGAIAPGLAALGQTLSGATGLSGADYAQGRLLGNDTLGCINAGTASLFEGFLRVQHQLATDVLGPEPLVLVTGGDGPLVQGVLASARLCPDLVLDGLALALPLPMER